MKRTIILLSAICILSITSFAQVITTKTGSIRFYSDAPLEKIEATNNQVNAALNTSTGEFAFKVLTKSFVFEKALMQEHFNENFMESDKYPLSTFNGKITNLKDINFSKDGTYNATVEGDLTIHGVTQKVKETGTIEVKSGTSRAKSTFNVLLKDYNIKLPDMVFNKVSETIQINVDAQMKANK